MKQALILFLFLATCNNAFSQERKYDLLWKKVDSLTKQKGLTSSALKEVENIYQIAKKEQNDPQIIKALIYRSILEEPLQEDANIKTLAALELEVKKAKEPAASILNSILAEKYWTYFQQNRWKFYGRSETSTESERIESWSIAQFHRKITSLYLASVKNEQLLQQVRIDRFEPIVIKGNARHLRPTLFDLLAHRAIEYFKNDERDVTRPAFAFFINDPMAFAPAEQFTNRSFVTPDSISLQHKAIQLYQRVLKFHSNDTDPSAFVDADIQRILFVRQYGQMENKDSLYLLSIEHLIRRFPEYKISAYAYYLAAQWHADKASTYNALTDTSYRFEYRKAKEIAEKIIQSKIQDEAFTNTTYLLNEINRQHLEMHTEKVNLPGQPFRTLVSFRNMNTLHLRIIQLTNEQQQQFRERYAETYWQRLATLPALKSWTQELPQTNDHQQHSVEIKIDELPTGNYILVAAPGANLHVKGQAVAAQHFYVSAISYVSSQRDYFILHRETGKPLANATVQIWNEAYDYNTRKYNLTAAEKLQADQNGFVRVKERARGNTNIKLEITHNNDRLFQDENHYGIFTDRSRPSREMTAEAYEKSNARIFFFTDRSLYRPGQLIYFKGIAITRDYNNRKNKILSAKQSTVKLYNANGEVVDSLKLTTNEFGTYNGTFRLPEHILNGSFRLRDEGFSSETYFSVEEYKRPKFQVTYEEVKGSYRLGDSIRITGVAKAYAGNNISAAAVNYTVVREARFLYPWFRGKWGFPRTARINVAHGTATTDSEGKFSVSFLAIPDRSVDTSLQPVFDYKIISTITDLNGETRMGEKIISVSYKALQLELNLSPITALPLDSFKRVSVNTRNVNGQPETALVKLEIYRLKPPARMIRKRYWPQPDLFVMNRETFLKHFPTDEYHQESAFESWEKGEKVYESTDSSNKATAFVFPGNAFSEGSYVAQAVTRDKYGEEVRNTAYFQLYDGQQNKMALPLYSWNAQNKTSVEPGEKMAIGVGSAANDLFIIQHIDRDMDRDRYMLPEETSASPVYNFLSLNNEKKWTSFTVNENDRGGFGVFHFFVKDNRFYMLSNQVNVPWSDKMLSISYETFRDKTLPGSEEQWKIKISGHKNEKVAAELLASMYDASLDQYNPHNWSQPGIWPVYHLNHKWNWTASFIAVESQLRYSESGAVKSYTKTYDRLINTNSGFGSARDLMRRIPGVAVQNSGALSEALVPTRARVGDGNAKTFSTAAPPATEQSADLALEVSEEDQSENVLKAPEAVQLRKNFNETAFFFPDLKTDAEGNISFSFTIPEALTRWKFQALSHTKELAFALSTKEVITQKELMVQPNAPRFLREGDRMELSTKIANLSSKEITGTVHLELLNAATMQPIDGWFQNASPNQYFTVEAGKSSVASFRLEVPYQYNSAVLYRFTAKSTATNNQPLVSDGEESLLPVLTNSILVTESVPLPLNGSETKTFRFEKLLNAANSETLKHHALTVEFTSNPAWYAVQALPYLSAPKYESADHLFNRFYANALALKIANASPRIMEIFQKWKTSDTAALISNLQKNPELKSVLLQETPWVLQAKTETEQKRNIALLFDMVKTGNELAASLEQVKQMQSPNGGFMWFKGGPDDRNITQYILTSLGRLRKLDAVPLNQKETINGIIYAAVKYLDERIKDDHNRLLKQTKTDLNKNRLGYTQIQYLYMRSFFSDISIPGNAFNAVNYYRKQSQQFWVQQSRYMQGMIALSLQRTGDKAKTADIIKSLKENSIVSEEMGRYWKDNVSGYLWHQAPVETQALLIEAFSEIEKDSKVINQLKVWLLKQKQTQNWKTNKATADACYALLMEAPGTTKANGAASAWLDEQAQVEIMLGSTRISNATEKEEAGTGYFKKTLDPAFIKPEMGNLTVKVTRSGASESPSWGAVYWQYFERLDRITPAATPLRLEKKLFVEKNTDRGPILVPVAEGHLLKTGDKIKVRIELKVDRDMEYLHMKDMRASCMEPVNVLSGYKWQGGLGYYETTRDASTSFFFNWLPKGSYVFEYPLFVTHSGNFSNGITSIESMYAPEFSSHSEGVRVNVE